MLSLQNDNILGEGRSGFWEKIDLGPKVLFQFADHANDISWVKVAAGRGCSVPGKAPDRFPGGVHPCDSFLMRKAHERSWKFMEPTAAG